MYKECVQIEYMLHTYMDATRAHTHVWLYMATYAHTWPYLATYGNIWPYMAMHAHTWPENKVEVWRAGAAEPRGPIGPWRLPGLNVGGLTPLQGLYWSGG